MPLFLYIISYTNESSVLNSATPSVLEIGAIVIYTVFSDRTSIYFQEIPEVIKIKEDLTKNWVMKWK